MVNYGFTFNGQHSIKDLGVILEYKKILPPPKKKLKLDVPYMNGAYDFSTVGSLGEQVYGQRTIEIKIDLVAKDKTKEDLQKLYSRVNDWLLDCSKSQLIFDDDKNFYYMGEPELITSFDETWYWGFMVFTFTCDPFKCSVFNNTLNLTGPYSLYNQYATSYPTIAVIGSGTLTIGTQIVALNNETINYLKLPNGINNINFTGFTSIHLTPNFISL